MSELISHCIKNCLDRCGYFDVSFCLKVITLCPPTFPQLGISPCYRYNLIPPHTPFHQLSIFFVTFPGLYVLNFRGPRHGITASSSDGSCFGLYTDLNFCTEYSYTGQTLNSQPESCVCWLLSLKCQACQMDSKWFLLIV